MIDVILQALKMHDAMHPRPSQVTQTQAAEMLGVSRATVNRLVRGGELRLNRCGLIPVTEVDKVLAAR